VDVDAIKTALLDELLISEDKTLTSRTLQGGETLVEPLSERELAVLTLIADGRSNREIADQLFPSVATVKWYLTHIHSKLGVQCHILAIMRTRQLNLVPSFSQPFNRFENALMESFWGKLKTKYLHRHLFEIRVEA